LVTDGSRDFEGDVRSEIRFRNGREGENDEFAIEGERECGDFVWMDEGAARTQVTVWIAPEFHGVETARVGFFRCSLGNETCGETVKSVGKIHGDT